MVLTILEGAVALSVANIFTQAGEVMTGLVTLSTSFVGSLWEHPIGIVIIVLPFVGGAIALARSIFLRRKHVR